MNNNITNPFQEAHKVSLNGFFQQETGMSPTRSTRQNTAYNWCPSCGQSEKTSDKFSILKDTTFRCFSCSAAGDIVDLGVTLWGCTKIESAKRIAGISDYQPVDIKTAAQFDEHKEIKDQARHQVLMMLGQISVDWFRTGDVRPHLAYLTKRGFSQSMIDSALKRQMIGFLPADAKMLTELITSEIGRTLLEKAGFWKSEKKMPGIINRPLVHFLPGMQSAEFSLLHPPTSPEQSKRIRYGSSEFPYYWKGTSNTSRVVGITEGFFDLLALAQLDPRNDIIGIPGASVWTSEMLEAYGSQFSDKKTFHIWLDADPGGRNGATNIANALELLGYPYKVHDLPDGQDVNDVLLTSLSAA